jgi:hypothetical protein
MQVFIPRHAHIFNERFSRYTILVRLSKHQFDQLSYLIKEIVLPVELVVRDSSGSKMDGAITNYA